jgi:ubiquinone/menaquinone biosynthesis C-methylase UbiE
MNNVIDYFSKRASVYNSSDWVNDKDILHTILKCLNSTEASFLNILDLGAGTGAVSNYLLYNLLSDTRIVALDVCAEMLQKNCEQRILKILSSAEKMPFIDNSFDVIVSRQCMHYIDDLNKAIDEIKRVLKCGGIFVLSQFVPLETETKNFWIDMMKVRQPLRKNFYSEKDWIELFIQHGFSVNSVERYSKPYSIKKWAQTYNVEQNVEISPYQTILKNAPIEYIKEYGVREKNNDILINSFGVTISFQKDK